MAERPHLRPPSTKHDYLTEQDTLVGSAADTRVTTDHKFSAVCLTAVPPFPTNITEPESAAGGLTDDILMDMTYSEHMYLCRILVVDHELLAPMFRQGYYFGKVHLCPRASFPGERFLHESSLLPRDHL